jgi:hypothetical protein
MGIEVRTTGFVPKDFGLSKLCTEATIVPTWRMG